MADPVWADPDRMGVVTPQVDELAQKTLAARTVLLETLGRLYGAPGVDDVAALAFRAAHDRISESVVDALQDFVGIANGILTGSEPRRTVGKPLLGESPADQTPNEVPLEPMTAADSPVDDLP